MKYNFPKQEKVVSLKIIEALFSKTSYGIFVHPFKIAVIPLQNQLVPCQVLIIVPKRNFKNAVDRNRIKRQIREIYRLNKHILLVSNSFQNIQIAFSISFVGKIKLDSKQLEVSIVKALKLIVQHVEKINPIPISPIH
jgi:ribonuclease P protein component